LRRKLFALAALLILSSFLASVGAQAFPISLNFGTALPMPIGQTDTVAVTVKNVVNSTVQLTFVGLRFEWSQPNNFFIGGNSEKGAVLAAGEQIIYPIAVAVPGNITAGTHRLSGYVTYRVFQKGNWTGVLAGWWVADLQFAYPQAQQSQTATGGGSPQTFTTLETVAVLAAVVAIGLFLERGRIIRFVGKHRASKPGLAEPEGEKPKTVEQKPADQKEEEDL
jgi:hypothetical protein